MRNIMASILVISVLGSASFAGWQRSAGRTVWIDKPTAASCFARDRTKDVYPKRKVLVYNDTVMLLDTNSPAGTGVVYNTGYFTIDAYGDIHPISGLSNHYDQVNDLGALLDVEFDLDEYGDVSPKN